MGKLLGPEFLARLDKNPEYTRAGVDRLDCIINHICVIKQKKYMILKICLYLGFMHSVHLTKSLMVSVVILHG